MRSRMFICIVFMLACWLTSANSAKAQGGNATVASPTVKKPSTIPKKPAAVKPPSSPKTTTAKQPVKSNNSSRRKSVTGTSNKTESAASDKRAMSKAKSKSKGEDEVIELKNPNDGQIEITKNTGGLKLVQYFIFLLTNASNGLYIGAEDELKDSVRCEFEGGGTTCKETDLVAYKNLLGPFATYDEAKTALCRSITETKNFPLGIGLKGRWLGSDNWYGLWDVSVDDCPSRTGGKQTGTVSGTNKVGGEVNSIFESILKENSSATGVMRTDNGLLEFNISFNGDTLTYYRGTSVAQCQADCTKNGNCKGFTFVKENGYQKGDPPMCYLISRITGSVSHACCISGRKP